MSAASTLRASISSAKADLGKLVALNHNNPTALRLFARFLQEVCVRVVVRGCGRCVRSRCVLARLPSPWKTSPQVCARRC
jgi:hypothetical protein